MKAETSCDIARAELSARLDGEIDEASAVALEDHLRTCPSCRSYDAALSEVRRAVRAQPVGEVPDLSSKIMARIEAHGPSSRRRDEWTARFRIGAIAAAASALVLLGTSLPWLDSPADQAVATEIADGVRAAALDLDSYNATFVMTERGWKSEVPKREFSAQIWYEAPERFRLSVRDQTPYPGPYEWPQNNIDLAANGGALFIREPSTCPTKALPGCAVGGATTERSVTNRQPFDGSTALPTDIILPLETLAAGEDFEVLGEETLIDRTALHVRLPYRRAAPLIAALQAGGTWREFAPSATVDLWIDKATWFPLRFTVRPSRAGRVLLNVSATKFTEPESLPDELFEAHATSINISGLFHRRAFAPLAGRIGPSYLAGLRPYRAGVVDPNTNVVAYAGGMTWLKVSRSPRHRSNAYRTTAEEIVLDNGGFAYYEPAAVSVQESFRRRVDVYGRSGHFRIESNLGRAELLAVASSLPARGLRVAAGVYGAPGLRIERLEPRPQRLPSFASTPAFLPEGYGLTAAFKSEAQSTSVTVSLHYRRAESDFDSFGIRITHSPTLTRLPPSSENLRIVEVNGSDGRWSPERGELEWIDNGIYRAVAAPSFDLATVAAIAGSLR